MGIKMTCNTKARASLKLANSLRSYLFEQECGELKGCSTDQINKLKDALVVLNSIIKRESN